MTVAARERDASASVASAADAVNRMVAEGVEGRERERAPTSFPRA